MAFTNVQRLLKRIDRSLSGPIVEFSEQFLYGHREILCTYANLPNTAAIAGSVEHGWALDSGRGIRKFHGGRYLYLSWSDNRMKRSLIEHKKTVAIGAPFIYLATLLEGKLAETSICSQRSLLFFPVHGNEFSQQNARSQIQLFSEKFDPNKATVCLYWVEYVNPEIYKLYSDSGFSIVCAGFSGQMEHTGLGYTARKLAGSPIGGRQNFLINTIRFILNHQKIVLGGLGSVLFYSSFLGKEIELLHKYIDTDYLDMDYLEGNSFRTNNDEIKYRAYIEKIMRMDFEKIDFNSESFKKFVKSELGMHNQLDPNDLSELLLKNCFYTANPQSMQVFKEGIRTF